MSEPNKLQHKVFDKILPLNENSKYWQETLHNITDAMVENIINTSDEEILAEIIEDGKDPKEIANKIRNIITKARKKAYQGNNLKNTSKHTD